MSSSSPPFFPTGVAVSLLVVGGGLVYSFLQKKRQNRISESLLRDAPPVPEKHDDSSSTTRVVLVVGAGTIGSGFAAVFLSRGMKVHVYDPMVSRKTLEERIQTCWLAIFARGITTMKEPPFATALTKTDSLDDALAHIQKEGQIIDFVQECTWEDVDHKQKVLGELDRRIKFTTLIASSTSFIPWTLLVTQCTHKHRIMIGHPAIPHTHSFMEIYGANPEWTARCKEWYTEAAFDVIIMKSTIPGHVFNSFLRINMDHGRNLIQQGVASPEDVNKVLRHLGRDFYGRHAFLALPMGIGGDRGVEGGRELIKRIRKDAIFLVLFSGMKRNTPVPDFVARPASRILGRLIESLIPHPPEEYVKAFTEFERVVTKDGTISPQVAGHQACCKIYDIIPMEVDRDPFFPDEFKNAFKTST